MLYAFPSFNHLGALDICVVHWDLIPLEHNPVNALIIDVIMVGNDGVVFVVCTSDVLNQKTRISCI